MTLLGRQPAFWIGLIVTLVIGVISTLSTQGLISQALAGKVTDTVNALAQLVTLLAPVITGLLIKPTVTPIAAPVLAAGTVVNAATAAPTTVV